MAGSVAGAYLFSPESTFWRVNRETLTVLSASRALLLELAHPLVAAGVAQHSDFRRDPFGRLYRTMRTMTHLIYGDARRSLNHFEHCHLRVHGTLRTDVGPYLAGTRYRAQDPLLRLWVWATVIDSVLMIYQAFVAPLSGSDHASYYGASQILARSLGIPPACLPPTYDDFLNYMDAMLTSDLLTVGDDARAIVAALFAQPLIGPVTRWASFAGIGLLPARLRAEFGFEWDEARERRLRQWAAWSRRIRPWLPDAVCVNPHVMLAEWRWQRAVRSGAK
jgi:uncharacterized protein (DUF2236 family)